MASDYVPEGCTRDFSCCSGDHECEYRLPRSDFDNLTDQAPLTRVGVLPQNMALISPEVRTLREILFNHRALAGATALEITELMAELQPLLK